MSEYLTKDTKGKWIIDGSFLHAANWNVYIMLDYVPLKELTKYKSYKYLNGKIVVITKFAIGTNKINVGL